MSIEMFLWELGEEYGGGGDLEVGCGASLG